MGIEKAVRVWPHKVNGEGHFIARLQKSPAAPDLSPVFPALEMGSAAALPDGQAALFAAFCREALTPEAESWLEAGAFTLFDAGSRGLAGSGGLHPLRRHPLPDALKRPPHRETEGRTGGADGREL